MKQAEQDPRTALEQLGQLALEHTVFVPEGFSLDLSKTPERWDELLRILGRKPAYDALAGILCRAFLQRTGREFLFSDACVAFELGYHIDAYLWTRGFRGYPRHVTTWLIPKTALDRHCRTVEISEKDLSNLPQRILFRYRRGLRKK